MPVVRFQTFVNEFKLDLPELCRLYPPGPTIQQVCEYYGETRFRSERCVKWWQDRGLIGKIAGPGTIVYIVPADIAQEPRGIGERLSPVQQLVLEHLTRLSKLQGSKSVRYNVMSIATDIRRSNVAVYSSLKRLHKLGLINLSGSYDKHMHLNTLDLNLDY